MSHPQVSALLAGEFADATSSPTRGQALGISAQPSLLLPQRELGGWCEQHLEDGDLLMECQTSD